MPRSTDLSYHTDSVLSCIVSDFSLQSKLLLTKHVNCVRIKAGMDQILQVRFFFVVISVSKGWNTFTVKRLSEFVQAWKRDWPTRSGATTNRAGTIEVVPRWAPLLCEQKIFRERSKIDPSRPILDVEQAEQAADFAEQTMFDSSQGRTMLRFKTGKEPG